VNVDLASLLPGVLPRAIAWAELQEQQVLALGAPLGARDQALASAVGVRRPELIRVQVVDALPLPDDHELRTLAIRAGLLGPGMIGLTFGYAVSACRGHDASPRLLSHEFRHVYQYEALGSIKHFLPVYLQQIAQFGYHDAPLEVDARAHEIDA
jgi:hypothetical protein